MCNVSVPINSIPLEILKVSGGLCQKLLIRIRIYLFAFIYLLYYSISDTCYIAIVLMLCNKLLEEYSYVQFVFLISVHWIVQKLELTEKFLGLQGYCRWCEIEFESWLCKIFRANLCVWCRMTLLQNKFSWN